MARIKSTQLPVPSENVEQQCLLRWAKDESGAYPELNWLYHVPNGGQRSKAAAKRFKAEGVKAGVPDLCLPIPRGAFHGLYIELKRIRGGCTSQEQKDWIEELRRQGYCAAVCKGWEEAAGMIKKYLKLEA